MEPDKQYHSYLVRIWRDEVDDQEGSSPPRWQGEVIHIQTGQHWQAPDLEPMMELLRDLTIKDLI
jgi:hypothetical protein